MLQPVSTAALPPCMTIDAPSGTLDTASLVIGSKPSLQFREEYDVTSSAQALLLEYGSWPPSRSLSRYGLSQVTVVFADGTEDATRQPWLDLPVGALTFTARMTSSSAMVCAICSATTAALRAEVHKAVVGQDAVVDLYVHWPAAPDAPDVAAQELAGIVNGTVDGVTLDAYADYAGTIPHQLFMVFQMMFAIITPALITGNRASADTPNSAR